LTDKTLDKARRAALAALGKYSKGRLDTATLEDEAQELLVRILESPPENLGAYIDRAARNRVINLLAKSARRKTDQLDGDPGAEDETRVAAEMSALQLLETERPEDYLFILKSIRLIDFLYRVSLAGNPANFTLVLCIDRALDALTQAKSKIDNIYSRFPPKDFGLTKFHKSEGVRIGLHLQGDIDQLLSTRESIKGMRHIRRLPEFALDAIDKLRADPAMLLLRVLYKRFKIGSGRYGAREFIRKIILELRRREAELGPNGEIGQVLGSITEKTKFETLRKKIYRKGQDGLYDRLADFICEACSESRPVQ